MVDRQDIDALLVGALYGELTPADEARLAAHLESHPADRAALDDLKTARQAVKQSRIFEVQDEPPQAVSALLLQEAHRRAPSIRFSAARVAEEREGWFARIARSFFAHPAMAAAAMLVVVVGVAGTLYMRKGGDEFANKEAAPATQAQPAQGAVAAPTPTGADNAMELDNGVAAGSGYAVQLDDNVRAAEGMKQQLGKMETDRAKLADKSVSGKADLDGSLALERQTPRTSKPTITAHVPEPQPKDLEPARKAPSKRAPGGLAGDDFGYGRAGASGGVAVGGAMPRDQAAMAPEAAPAPAAPPPPPPKANAISSADARTVAPAPGKNDAKSDPVTAWAQRQLQQAIQLAQSGDKCPEAAKIVQEIRLKAPAFYKDNVADNRSLKGCQVYMRNQEEERSKKMSPAKAPDMESMH